MKVLLTTPLDYLPSRYPDIGLGYLAAAIKRAGFDTVFFDAGLGNVEQRLSSILSSDKIDVVGIKLYTYKFNVGREIARTVKNVNRNITIIFGGPHPSGTAESILADISDADFAFKGEAELGLPLLLKELKSYDKYSIPEDNIKKISGLIYRRDKAIYINEPGDVKDLDSLGPPDWDFINPKKYDRIISPARFSIGKMPAPVVSTRGCPYRCTYCNNPTVMGAYVRRRSAKNILDEIEMLIQKYNVDEIQFIDSNFLLNKKLVREFCNLVIEKGLKFVWGCPTGIRMDSVDDETIALMKKAGCHYVALGIESGSDRILKLVGKKLTVEVTERAAKIINKNGIKTNAFFMIGFPMETMEDIQRTIDLSLKLPIDAASFAIVTPLPGTEIYQQYLKRNGNLNDKWKEIHFFNNSISLSDIPIGELVKIQKRAYLRFHLRPRIIYTMLKDILNLRRLRYYWDWFFTIYKRSPARV